MDLSVFSGEIEIEQTNIDPTANREIVVKDIYSLRTVYHKELVKNRVDLGSEKKIFLSHIYDDIVQH